MKEEVDEANGEDKDKTDTAADSKETVSKGTLRLSHIKLTFLHLVSVENTVLLSGLLSIHIFSVLQSSDETCIVLGFSCFPV